MDTIARIQDFDDPAYDPFVSDEAAFGTCDDPYPQLARWREQAAVHAFDYRSAMGLHPDVTMAGLPSYLMLGYDAVEKIFLDPATYSNKTYERNLGISFGRSVSTMDAPEHPRHRKIFQKAFLPNRVSTWSESLVDPVVASLMDAFAGRGRADLVQEFTQHYPFHIIYRQLALHPPTCASSTSWPSPRRSRCSTSPTAWRRRASWASTSRRCWTSVAAIRATTWSARSRRPRSTASTCPRRS
ncbi:MAG: hypothetical protein ACJ8IK_26555 [Burkholderiaceae bacterium]